MERTASTRERRCDSVKKEVRTAGSRQGEATGEEGPEGCVQARRASRWRRDEAGPCAGEKRVGSSPCASRIGRRVDDAI